MIFLGRYKGGRRFVPQISLCGTKPSNAGCLIIRVKLSIIRGRKIFLYYEILCAVLRGKSGEESRLNAIKIHLKARFGKMCGICTSFTWVPKNFLLFLLKILDFSAGSIHNYSIDVFL